MKIEKGFENVFLNNSCIEYISIDGNLDLNYAFIFEKSRVASQVQHAVDLAFIYFYKLYL